MKKVKITVMRKVRHDDLIEKYENPLEHECTVEEGEVFIANGWVKPDDFCDRVFYWKQWMRMQTDLIIWLM